MRAMDVLVTLSLALVACGASLQQPARAPQPPNAFVIVPYPPPAARVETLPRPPNPAAVWVDGQWSWGGAGWSWTPGAWVEPPPGGRFAAWALELDGQLRFAPASWRDASGRELGPPRALVTAVGQESGQGDAPRCP